MSHARTFALIGSVVAMLSLAGLIECNWDSQMVSTGAQLYRDSIDLVPLLSGL